MATCATQTFSGVTPTAWACLKAKAAEQGFPIDSDQGSQSLAGFTIAWSYDAGASTLALTCTAQPFWATCAVANANIHSLIDGTGCLS